MRWCFALLLPLLALLAVACQSHEAYPRHQPLPPSTPREPTTTDKALQDADRIIAEARRRESDAQAAKKQWEAQQAARPPEVVISVAAAVQNQSPPATTTQPIARTETMEARAERLFGPQMAAIRQEQLEASESSYSIYGKATAACAGFTAGTSQGLIFDPFDVGGASGTDFLEFTSSIAIANSTTPLCRMLKAQLTNLQATMKRLRREAEDLESAGNRVGVYPGVIRKLWTEKYAR